MQLRVLELFAGCGGLSLGLKSAGHQLIAACEKDTWACDTYAFNFPETSLIRGDIASFNSNWWQKEFGGQIDLVAGGPPCQGFSVSGKRQFGNILQQNQLVKEYLRVVEAIKPRFVLIENVGGFKTGKLNGRIKALEFVLAQLDRLDYETHYTVLQATDFGVPSLRSRLFVIGSRTGFQIEPFPRPSHSSYPYDDLLPYVSTEQAISDLPPLAARQGKEGPVAYAMPPQNEYQQEMRKSSDGVRNHVVMKHTERLVERFKSIQQGSSAYQASSNNSAVAQPFTVYKSNNQRLRANAPSLCITANFQSNYIHYRDHRNLTAREAARLMTFPDFFHFCGKRTVMSSSFLKRYGREREDHLSQYNQIGNAVPPKLAQAIGEQLSRIADVCGRPFVCLQSELNLNY